QKAPHIYFGATPTKVQSESAYRFLTAIRVNPLRRQGRPQAVLLDLPVPVFAAVDEDHRDAVAVLGAQLRVGVDVRDRPVDAQLAADSAYFGFGGGARRAVPAGQQRDHHADLRVARRSLPVTECGRASTNSTMPGTLNLARCVVQWSST